jgi:hypothetical protein
LATRTPDVLISELAQFGNKLPGLLALQVLQGELYLMVGQAITAVDAWYRAVRHYPNEDELWFGLGLALWQAGRRLEAGFALRRAADHSPHIEAYEAAFAAARAAEPTIPVFAGNERNLVVGGSEQCQKHGTGVLIKRSFGSCLETITLRPQTSYEGVEEVGGTHLCVPFEDLPPAELETRLRRLLAPYRIPRILCVPYHRAECTYALAAQTVTGAKLCTWVMDDQNIHIRGTDDHVLEALFSRSALRLAISSELQTAYMIKYNFDFEIMPPLVSNRAARRQNCWTTKIRPLNHAALVGSIWTESQMQQLVRFVKRTGLTLDWFGKPHAQDLSPVGIHSMGCVSEEVLADRLTEYPFVVVPSGVLDGTEDNEWLTRLSLPSRIVFLLQTQTPVLVVGSKDTCAGRHVLQLGIGAVIPYNHPDPVRAIRDLTSPASRAKILTNAARAADGFVMPEAGRWIWESTEAGVALPAPFHAFIERRPQFDIVWPPEAAGKLPISHDVVAA